MFKKIFAVILAAAFAVSLMPASHADVIGDRAALLDAYPELEIFDETDFTDQTVSVDGLDLGVPSTVLIEKETGRALVSVNANERRPPASVTKVMTLLIIFETLDAGIITLEDKVPVSAYAMNMGGSQVFMHEGEQYSVRDMIKSIVIASGNDASVAMAEFLSGSEETFVERMNERAAELGMKDTRFKNCNGLPEEGHFTSAYDIALMSRELLNEHPTVKEYSTIWMDTLREGTFTLANTNKLVKFYPGATGLKTGSTSIAKFCLSASAERDGMEMIAVILGADSSDIRFNAARKLLDYGFANYQLISVFPDAIPAPVPVKMGVAAEVAPEIAEGAKLLIEKRYIKEIVKTAELAQDVEAPVIKGQKLGEITVRKGEEILTVIPITAKNDVARLTVWDIFRMIARVVFMG